MAEKFQTGFDQPLLYAMYVDCSRRWIGSRRSPMTLSGTRSETKLSAYVSFYAFLSQIIPYADLEVGDALQLWSATTTHLPRPVCIVKLPKTVSCRTTASNAFPPPVAIALSEGEALTS